MSSTANTTDSDDSTVLSTIASANLWEAFEKRVRAVDEECVVEFDEDGVHVAHVGPGKVASVHIRIQADAFESFEATEGRIGLDLTKFSDAIGLASSDELLHVDLDHSTRKLTIQGEEFEYTLAGIDPDQIRQQPDMPDLDRPVHFVIGPERLDTAADGGDLISDHIAIAADRNEEVVSAYSEGDLDDVSFDWDDSALEQPDIGESVESMFSLDYLGTVVDALGAEPVTIHLGDEFPITFEQEFADGAAEATYNLAPRIQSR